MLLFYFIITNSVTLFYCTVEFSYWYIIVPFIYRKLKKLACFKWTAGITTKKQQISVICWFPLHLYIIRHW